MLERKPTNRAEWEAREKKRKTEDIIKKCQFNSGVKAVGEKLKGIGFDNVDAFLKDIYR